MLKRGKNKAQKNKGGVGMDGDGHLPRTHLDATFQKNQLPQDSVNNHLRMPDLGPLETISKNSFYR